MKKYVIFGAGKFGMLALQKYKGQVECFIDNNEKLWGTEIEGFLVKSLDQYMEEDISCTILIATKSQGMIIQQLHEKGLYNYELYLNNVLSYNPTDELIYNPYAVEINRDVSEEKLNELSENSFKKQQISYEVDVLYNTNALFTHVEIETINRCNGNCDFCPVSVKNDTREFNEMTDQLFEKIIEELREINYSGKLALFSNNEPLLDTKIIERHRYAREKLPNARMHLFTNGTLLDIDTFIELTKYLDELIIDNYNQELKLIKPCERIVEYCEEYPELKKKVTIVLRKPYEILSSRGGDAPNRKSKISLEDTKCVLPFKQMIIRPDGKVSLCCNDALGKNTLGDVSKDTLIEIWNNDRFKMVRKCLNIGRTKWEHCKYCDFMSLG